MDPTPDQLVAVFRKLAHTTVANEIAFENILIALHPAQQHTLRDQIGGAKRVADSHLQNHPEILRNRFPGLFD